MTRTHKHPIFRHEFFFPVLLFFLSALLRFALISQGPFSIDTLKLAQQAEHTLATGQPGFLLGTGYPLTVLLGAFFLAASKILGNTDPVFAVNVMSVVLSALSVAWLYTLGARWIDRRSAFLAAVLWSFFPFHLGLSVYGMSHAPSIFFLLLSLNLLLRFRHRRRALWLALAACGFGCMGASRIQDLVLLIPAISFLFWDVTSGNTALGSFRFRVRAFLAFWTLAFITMTLFHVPLILHSSQNGYWQQLQWYWRVSSGQNFLGVFSPALLDTLRWLLFGLTPIGCLVSLGGGLVLLKKRKDVVASFLLWLVVPIFFAGNLSMTTPRFVIAFFIPAVMAAGTGFAALLQARKRLLQGTALAAFLVTVAVPFYHLLPTLLFRHHYALMPEFARFVQRQTEPDALIITGDEGAFISHYGKRNRLGRPQSEYHISPHELQIFGSKLKQLLQDGVPVYITSSGLYTYNARQAFSNFLEQHFQLEYVGEHWTEDWHFGATRLRIGKDKLFRIKL